MKTSEEIKKWLLENCVDDDGDLLLNGLDFSDFDGDVYFNFIKVKGSLYQDFQTAYGNLNQSHQRVGGHLNQDHQRVIGHLWQHNQEVFDSVIYQSNNKVNGKNEN